MECEDCARDLVVISKSMTVSLCLNSQLSSTTQVNGPFLSNFAACGRAISYQIAVAGNRDLEPENSTDWTVGTVLQPKFRDAEYGRLTLTTDFWSIRQDGIIEVWKDH